MCWRRQGAFIPHTDTDVYKDYPSWVRSFYAGFGVHAEDVARCVTCAVTHVDQAGPRAAGSEEVVPIVTRKNLPGLWDALLSSPPEMFARAGGDRRRAV